MAVVHSYYEFNNRIMSIMLNILLEKNTGEDGSYELPIKNERGKGQRGIVKPASYGYGLLRI